MDIPSHLSEAVSVSELFIVRLGWLTKAVVPPGFLAVSPLGSLRPTDSRDCRFGVLRKGKKLSGLVPWSLTVQTSLLLFKKANQTRFSPSSCPLLCVTWHEHPITSAQLQPPSKTARPWVIAGMGRAVPILPSNYSLSCALLGPHPRG